MSMKFISKEEGVGDIPPMTNTVAITTEHVTLKHVVEAFKVFLVGCTYSQKLVDRIVMLEEGEEV